jgi:transcriptional regulator with XRE-family HTH domain
MSTVNDMELQAWRRAIRLRREALGASYTEVERHTGNPGVTDQAIKNIEIGKSTPRPKTITAINAALDQMEEIDKAVSAITGTMRSDALRLELTQLWERFEALAGRVETIADQVNRIAAGPAKSQAKKKPGQ